MPGENIQAWSVTAVDNGSSDSSINWSEGQPRASVNNSARSMMAAHAKDRNLHNGSITTAGVADAYTFNSGLTYTTIPTGLRVTLFIHATNTGASTLNMDGIGAVAILNAGSALTAGTLVISTYAELIYNGTNWLLVFDTSDKVNVAGDTMTGPLVVNSSITASGVISATGGLNSGAGITITGDCNATGNLSAGGNLSVANVTATGGLGAGTAGITSAGDITAVGEITAGAGGSGFFGPYISLTGDGYKPGGGPWTDSSDIRIKNILADYTDGLEVVKQLRPVRYTFKGNDGHAAGGKEYVGLIAQDVEDIMPYMVKKQAGQIDGQPVTDLRMLDTSALIYALINSVQELSERIEELEAR